MSRHRIRSISNPSLHRSNSNTSSSAIVTRSLLNDPSPNVAASSAMAAAAAAAALRSQPTSSVSIADVKTKRILRRKSMASSHCDPGVAVTELQVLRKSSSGSMLQRSFRQSSSTWSQMPTNIPPVPPLPDKIPQKIPDNREELKTNEAFHSQKISRQTLSLGSNRLMESATRPITSYNQKSSSSPSSGRFSINFSLPTDSRPNSPVTQRRFISPLTANLTSVISSGSSDSVNDISPRKLISDAEPFVSKEVIDTSEESLTKKGSLTQSQIKRLSLVTDKLPGNSSKSAKTSKNLMTGTKKTSTLSAKYPFMNKPSFFSSTNKTIPSKLELTDDQAHATSNVTTTNTTDNDDNDLEFLKPLEFEKFPSNFSIDRDQFNYFDHEDRQKDPTATNKPVDNKCSTDIFHQAKESSLSPLLIHPTNLSSGQTLDLRISIGDLNFENNSESVHNHVSQISVEGNSVRNSEEILEKNPPLQPMLHFPVNPKCSAAINYLTHSTNHPCKSALKFNASSLTVGGNENLNKVSTDESHSRRRINKLSFDKEPSVSLNSSSIIDFQKIRDWSNQDSEKTKDESFSMRINKIMKPRTRVSSFGSVCCKKKQEDVEEHRLVRPLEKIDYILSPLLPVSPKLPVSPLSSPTYSYPSLEMSENEDNKKRRKMIISDKIIDENLDNATNIQISKNLLHNHIESIRDHPQALDDFSSTKKTLQNAKSAENLKTLTFEQMSGESNLTSKSSSKLLTVNTSESYLTFLESPNSSLYSQSPNNLKTPTSATTITNMKLERLHVPGAWDSLNEDLDKNSKSDLKPDVGINKFSYQIENQPAANDVTTIHTHQVKKDSPQVLGISEKNSIPHKTPENPRTEDDSEAASIYCDAVENIIIAENSDYESNNTISTNPAVYEDKKDSRLQATKTNSTDRLHFAIPKRSDVSRSKRLTDLIIGRLPHRQISDAHKNQPLRNTEYYRSFSLTPKSLSEPVVKEAYTRSVSKRELLDSQEVKFFLPGISMRHEEYTESVSSFRRARPIVRELHLRSSMRDPIKPKANKFRLSALNSSRYETSSSSLTHTCNLRAASKFRFSKIRNRDPLSLPRDEKIIKKNTNSLSNYSECQDSTHPTLNIQLTNFSNDDIMKSRKSQKSEVSQLSLKAPIVQNHLDDFPDIQSNRYHESNEYSDPSNNRELNETACSVSLKSIEQNKTISSTQNINIQTPIKPKENIISMIRRMKADVNDKVRKQEKEKISTRNTTQDLQNQTYFTLKNQDISLNSPNQAFEQNPSWPLPTSDSINTQITNLKSPKLYINQTTTVTSAGSPIERYFSDSDKLPRISNSTRPDSSHQKKHGSLRRMLRRDG